MELDITVRFTADGDPLAGTIDIPQQGASALPLHDIRVELPAIHFEAHCIAEIVAVHAAYMEAIERVLGAPPNSLARADIEAVNVWVAALRGNVE